MNEDFSGRIWAENHERFSEDLGRALTTFWRGFQRLTAAQFDAPWRRDSSNRELVRK